MRNGDTLGIRNGFTCATQAPSAANVGGVGRHCPGWVPTAQVWSPNDPSFFRAATIAAAAWRPTEIPDCFPVPSGIAASESSYCARSRVSWPGKRARSTWYAAVATAASVDACRPARGATRYGWYGVPAIAFTAS